MPHLIFLDEPFGGRSYELICERTSVGRGSENTLTIRDSSLSRQHCEILTFGSEVIVHDLGSRNGTFVDGRRLNGSQAQAKHGQVIAFGNVQVRLDIDYVDEEMDEDTAIHDFANYRDHQNGRASAEAVHLALPGKGGFIDETIQLKRESKSMEAAPAEFTESAVATARRPTPWLIITIALLLLLLVFLLR